MKTEDLIRKYKEFLLEVEDFNKQNGNVIRFDQCEPTFENFMFYLEHGYIVVKNNE